MTNASGSRKAINAEGTLAQTPLSNALVYIRNKRLTGVLELTAPGSRDAKFETWRGMISHATTTPAVARFGAVVYELGFIDAKTLDDSGAASLAKQKPQADLLVETGAITEAQKKEVLAEQIRRRVHHAFTFPADTKFVFAEATPAATEPPITVDPLAPVWRGILDYPPRADVEHVIFKVGSAPIRLLSESPLERAGLEEEERRLCELLSSKAMTVAEFRAASRLPPDRTDLLLYLLLIAKCAAPPDAEAPPPSQETVDLPVPAKSRKLSFKVSSMSMPAATAGAPYATESGELPPGPADLGLDGIRKRAAGLAFESPYDALGLREGASVEAARAAYMRLAKLWHPDRLPEDLQSAQTEVTRIYVHVRDSFRAITAAGNESHAN